MKSSLLFLFTTGGILLLCSPAFATQAHSDPEGLYVHQLSHIFFVFSMAILIYWLRVRNLVKEKGWRYIQYAAFLFILWTLDAFTVHLLDEQYLWVNVSRVDRWQLRIDSSQSWLNILYYIVKLDHLLSVPAMIFFYAGLKRLSRTIRQESEEGEML